MTSHRSLLLLRRLHTTTAIRIVRGYWTISYASTTVLAVSPPFELQTLAKTRSVTTGPLDRSCQNWEAWRDRGRLPLFFRMMQMLAAHGIFVEYLQRIGREVTNICHHCGEGEDTAQHTLEFCPAWEVPRRIPMASHWREIRPLVSCEANGKTRVSRSSSILRRRNARKATNKVGERENILPLQGSCAALGGYRGRHAEEDLDLLRLARRPRG